MIQVDDIKYTREWLNELLVNNTAKITFTKKDGSERVMSCTLQTEFLPKRTVTEDTKPTKPVNTDIIPVWDIENKGWRSIIIKSIKEIYFSV